MRVSSKTSIPSSSHASSSSGVGGLCDVRMRIAAHLLQLADAVILHRVRQRRADPGVVLVIARPFQLHRLAVEEESLLPRRTSSCECRTASRSDRRPRRPPRPPSPACRDSVSSSDHSSGCLTDNLLLVGLLAVLRESDAAGVAALPNCACPRDRAPSRSRAHSAHSCRRCSLPCGSKASPRPAAPRERTKVPHCFTCTGCVFTSQTCR